MKENRATGPRASLEPRGDSQPLPQVSLPVPRPPGQIDTTLETFLTIQKVPTSAALSDPGLLCGQGDCGAVSAFSLLLRQALRDCRAFRGFCKLISIFTLGPGQVDKGPVCPRPREGPVVKGRLLCLQPGQPTVDTALSHQSCQPWALSPSDEPAGHHGGFWGRKSRVRGQSLGFQGWLDYPSAVRPYTSYLNSLCLQDHFLVLLERK